MKTIQKLTDTSKTSISSYQTRKITDLNFRDHFYQYNTSESQVSTATSFRAKATLFPN